MHIGDGVWLGGGTIVRPGVTIGENTVAGGRQRGGQRSAVERAGCRQSRPCGAITLTLNQELVARRSRGASSKYSTQVP
ncbi:hypothetical protein [Rhizobium ruizarguesonis]|uniref:hypothetical protein n=1 Tax=Rhizobium ruizarguesonis TaxID=2081791 RepID=UPI001FDEAD75